MHSAKTIHNNSKESDEVWMQQPKILADDRFRTRLSYDYVKLYVMNTRKSHCIVFRQTKEIDKGRFPWLSNKTLSNSDKGITTNEKSTWIQKTQIQLTCACAQNCANTVTYFQLKHLKVFRYIDLLPVIAPPKAKSVPIPEYNAHPTSKDFYAGHAIMYTGVSAQTLD